MSRTSATAFSSLMKNITVVPLFGTSFTVYTPLIMTLIAGMTVVNVYARLLNALGLDHEDAIINTNSAFRNENGESLASPPDEYTEKIEFGKKLIAAEIRSNLHDNNLAKTVQKDRKNNASASAATSDESLNPMKRINPLVNHGGSKMAAKDITPKPPSSSSFATSSAALDADEDYIPTFEEFDINDEDDSSEYSFSQKEVSMSFGKGRHSSLSTINPIQKHSNYTSSSSSSAMSTADYLPVSTAFGGRYGMKGLSNTAAADLEVESSTAMKFDRFNSKMTQEMRIEASVEEASTSYGGRYSKV
jgi:hypothetical protein